MKIEYIEFHKGRYERAIIILNRLWFLIDLSDWYIPFCFRITCCGNNNRIYNIRISLLCFNILFCVDEDSYDKGEFKSEQTDVEFNHEAFYEFLLNTINPNEMEKYRSMFLSSGEIANDE